MFPFFRDSDGTPRTPRCPDPKSEASLPAGAQWYQEAEEYSESDICCASNEELVGKPPWLCKADFIEYQARPKP